MSSHDNDSDEDTTANEPSVHIGVDLSSQLDRTAMARLSGLARNQMPTISELIRNTSVSAAAFSAGLSSAFINARRAEEERLERQRRSVLVSDETVWSTERVPTSENQLLNDEARLRVNEMTRNIEQELTRALEGQSMRNFNRSTNRDSEPTRNENMVRDRGQRAIMPDHSELLNSSYAESPYAHHRPFDLSYLSQRFNPRFEIRMDGLAPTRPSDRHMDLRGYRANGNLRLNDVQISRDVARREDVVTINMNMNIGVDYNALRRVDNFPWESLIMSALELLTLPQTEQQPHESRQTSVYDRADVTHFVNEDVYCYLFCSESTKEKLVETKLNISKSFVVRSQQGALSKEDTMLLDQYLKEEVENSLERATQRLIKDRNLAGSKHKRRVNL